MPVSKVVRNPYVDPQSPRARTEQKNMDDKSLINERTSKLASQKVLNAKEGADLNAVRASTAHASDAGS